MPVGCFRAPVLLGLNEPLKALELLEPEQLLPGQVLVKMVSSGICGSQIAEIEGRRGPDRYLPHLIGHEGFGEVVGLGPGVSRFTIKESVIVHWRKNTGISAPGSQLIGPDGLVVNAGPAVSLSEIAVVSEDRLTRAPDGIDPMLAPLLGCALTTAYGVVYRQSKFLPGMSVAVIGGGGIGIFSALLFRLAGASSTAVFETNLNRQRLATELGFDSVLSPENPRGQDFGSFDVVLEASGSIGGIEFCSEIVRPGGRIILVGVPPKDVRPRLETYMLNFGTTITGSNGGDSQPEIDIPRIAGMISSGFLDLSGLDIQRFAIEDVNLAIEELRRGSGIRTVVTF